MRTPSALRHTRESGLITAAPWQYQRCRAERPRSKRKTWRENAEGDGAWGYLDAPILFIFPLSFALSLISRFRAKKVLTFPNRSYQRRLEWRSSLKTRFER